MGELKLGKDDIPEVIRLRGNELIEVLEAMLEMAKSGQLKNLVAAGFTKEGNVFASAIEVDMIMQQTLISYLQVDATVRAVEACSQ